MKLQLKQLTTKEDFASLKKGDKCLIAIEAGYPHVRTFSRFSFIESNHPLYNDDYYRGTWIHFEESGSCDFTIERYFNDKSPVTDIYLISQYCE